LDIERTFSGNKSLDEIFQELVDIIDVPSYNEPKANIAPPEKSEREGTLTNE